MKWRLEVEKGRRRTAGQKMWRCCGVVALSVMSMTLTPSSPGTACRASSLIDELFPLFSHLMSTTHCIHFCFPLPLVFFFFVVLMMSGLYRHRSSRASRSNIR